jgi:protein gp37
MIGGPPFPRFSAADVERANAEWGANCGPAAIAAIMGMTLDEVRPHLGDFESKHYTNPTLMFAVLDRAPKFLPYTWFVKGGWPSNVWFGFTAEDQGRFDHCAKHARKIPAPVVFMSGEPMLGEIELPDDAIEWLDWVICGGESGPLAKIRDTNIEDMEHLAFQCALLRDGDRIGIPFFMKQMPQISWRSAYKKFDQFPFALRVREHPRIAA